MPLLNDAVVLTSLSQVMQVFPEPALETFEIPTEKIQGYILHESDIVRGLINYHYYLAQQNDIEMSLGNCLKTRLSVNVISVSRSN